MDSIIQHEHAKLFDPVLLEFMRHTRDEDSPVWYHATRDGEGLQSDKVLALVAAKLQKHALAEAQAAVRAAQHAAIIFAKMKAKADLPEAQSVERAAEQATIGHVKRTASFALVIDELKDRLTKRARTEVLDI